MKIKANEHLLEVQKLCIRLQLAGISL